MLIQRFQAKKVHGYLDFDVSFNEDVSFLIGINGTGKTTALKCMSALINPDLRTLAKISFIEMSIEIGVNDSVINILAKKDDGVLYLHVDGVEGFFQSSVSRILREDDHDMPLYFEADRGDVNQEVIEYIHSIPNPLTLNIDRATSNVNLNRSKKEIWTAHMSQSEYKRRFADTKLKNAIKHAESHYKSITARHARRSKFLRNEIIESALSFDEMQRDVDLSLPDLKDLKSKVDVLKSTLEEIDIKSPKIHTYLNQFYSSIENISNELGGEIDFDNMINDGDSKKLIAYMDLKVQTPYLLRINMITNQIDKYKERARAIYKESNVYLNVINGFYEDSDKKIEFNDKSELVVRIKGKPPQPISTLSSGESQLLVILTHLAFNDDATKANVFIVDEPELSLHIHWQEQFVDAINMVNPKLQLIFATHAPSIIVDKEDKCIDL